MTSSAARAAIVGSGPNGLSAAVHLAGAGIGVEVVEAHDRIGGGTRSAELTLPGFVHDVCSSIHPFAVASPFFRSLPLENYGLEWLHPGTPLAHPLDDGSAGVLLRSFEDTARELGRDERSYRRLIGPSLRHADHLVSELLGPLRVPRHPIVSLRYGITGIRSARALVRRFDEPRTRALFGGVAAHSMLRLSQAPTAGVAVLFAIVAHAFGWPAPRGGAESLPRALGALLESLGGTLTVGRAVDSVDEFGSDAAVLLNMTPRQAARLAGSRFPRRYAHRLGRFRYGPGVFKLDWALDGPVPWTAPACSDAGTVHVGGTFEEIAASEDTVNDGGHPERPFVLVTQPSVFDSSRAPAGRHTAWAYCHVPHGSDVDMTDAIERQIERFAPGFRDRILARHALGTAALEHYNPNYIGGDINGGIQDLRQHFGRPLWSTDPYATPDRNLYLCSSSTPPGGGVHGMAGYFAARSALRRSFGIRS